MGRSSRTKGAAAERELGAILSDALGRVVQRILGQARIGGEDFRVEHFTIEAKRCEKVELHKWWSQAVVSAQRVGDKQIPVVAFRRSRESWRVVLNLSDFLPLMRGELTGGTEDGNSNSRGGERGINEPGDDQNAAGQTEHGAGKALGAGLLGAGGDGKGTDVTS